MSMGIDDDVENDEWDALIGRDDDWDETELDEDRSYCPQCRCVNYPMGSLGMNVWYRCRNCGWEWNIGRS